MKLNEVWPSNGIFFKAKVFFAHNRGTNPLM